MTRRDLAILILSFAAALFVRVWFVHSQVFIGGVVRLQATDPWYHVRLAENTTAHFPRVSSADPYLGPDGPNEVPVAPLFALLIAAIALIAGDVAAIGAWLPPLIGAATVVPIFYLSKAVWGDRAWIAPVVYAVLPGQTLQRSMLGYSDHHVLEMFFSTAVMLFFVRALPEVAEESEAQRRRSRRTVEETPPRLFPTRECILAGAALFLYLMGWRSGLFFVALLCAAALVASLVRQDREALRIALGILVVTAAGLLVAAFAFPVARRHLIAIVAAAFALGAGDLVLGFALKRERPRLMALAGFAIVGAVAVGALSLVQPQFVSGIAANLSRFNPKAGALFVGEARPLTALQRPFGYLAAEMGLLWIFVLIALAVLGRVALSTRNPRLMVVLVWAAFTGAAAFAQIRFLYYFGIAAAVVAIGLIVRRSGFATAIFVLILMAPSLYMVKRAASRHDGPNMAWLDALRWVRANTPEPFGDPRVWFEYADRTTTRAAQSSVMAWWDFGYWIIRSAHRVPVANPTQKGVVDAAKFFTAQDEETAEAIAERLRVDTVLVDDSMVVSRTSSARVRNSGTMPAMAAWAGETMERYFERVDYRNPATGRIEEAIVFYPEYFRAMGVRMMLFGGGAAREKASYVATLAPGNPRPRVADLRRFATYAEAAAYAAGGQNRRIVAVDPTATCLPVDALRRYQRAQDVIRETGGQKNAVRIFRRLRNGPRPANARLLPSDAPAFLSSGAPD